MDSKGNVVAMSVTAIIIIIGIAAFIATFYQTPAPTVPISTALSETKISINKALALGISEWAETGFDQQNAVWYNNGNFPPSLEETKQSLRDAVRKEITDVLNELEVQRGYTYEFDNPAEGMIIEFGFDDVVSTDELNKQSITVKVGGFSVKDEKGNVITVKEFETEEKFDYAVWNLYSEMYEWAENDSGGISLHLQELLDSAPYQLQLCDCGLITKTTEDSVILKGSITWNNRIDPNTGETIQGMESFVIEPALQDLQARFADKPSVICSYVVEDKTIENIPNIIKRGQAGCSCPGGTGLENSEEILGTTVSSWRTDEVGKPELYYGIIDSNEEMREDVNSKRGFPILESFLRVERTNQIPPLTYKNCSEFNNNPEDEGLCNAGQMCFHTDTACIQAYANEDQAYLLIEGDNEVIGMTRRVAALVRFKCEDSASRVKTEKEFKNLGAEVLIRFAVLKGAEPPDFCTTEDGPVCEYGGSAVTPNVIGLECTPWDDCFLNPEDAVACGVCECMIGSQIIDPLADAIGADLFARHEAGEIFSCDDDGDPACAWCHNKGGLFTCPASEEFEETTTDCQILIDETINAGKSEQCLLYSCDVENNTVKRGCIFNDTPVPCDSCRKCNLEGFCVSDDAKEGQMCVPPSSSGGNQNCYQCTSEGDCAVNAEAIGVNMCSNSYGCLTYCAADGTCTFINNEDLGLQCPTNKPDYECKECGIKNNKLICGAICDKGCCSDGSWGRCMNADGKCCPETNTLTDCPTNT